MRRRIGALLVLPCVFASLPAIASAQNPPSTPAADRPRWELEAYGGLSLGRRTGGGTLDLPLAGAPITTSSPVFPSWSVPSWFFGDGAAFLNNVAAEFGMTNRITPVDAWLRPLGVSDTGHVLAGVRLRRPLQQPWSLEIGFEISAQAQAVSDDVRAGLQASTESFQATFAELLATGPFTSPVIDTGLTSTAGASRDATLTVALNAPMRSFGGFSSYAVAGGGLAFPLGEATAGVNGRYRFRIAGVAPIDESDTLTLRYRGRVAFVAVGGAGLRRAVSDRWGIRIDGRVMAGAATTTVAVDAVPTSAPGTPAGFIESFTYPNLQFSNNASTLRRSTLGAPGLDGVDVFKGGWLLRGRATVGVYFLF